MLPPVFFVQMYEYLMQHKQNVTSHFFNMKRFPEDISRNCIAQF